MMTQAEYEFKRNVAIAEALELLDIPFNRGIDMTDLQVLTSLATRIEALVMLRTHSERG